MDKKALTLTLVREAGRECVKLPSARVRLRGPGREDAVVELGLRPITLGSAPDCDLIVDDPYISRRHCELAMTARGVVLRDLGSRNGVCVKSIRLQEAVLPPGANVSLGKLSLTVEEEGAPVRLPLSEGMQFGEAVGKSVPMRVLFAKLEQAAQTAEPILMLGESGTGKELLAQGIHRASPRRDGPFLVLDCGAVAPSLIESELFGHEKGAFSGAQSARAGLFQAAAGGTLFLDELGELPLDLQPKLLRALESRQVRPVGSNRMVPVDVRVVAATHRDLQARIAAGTFRQDLYYRLAVVEVRVPPLRERREDIPLLVEQILAQRNPPCEVDDLPPNTLAMLSAHSWPGNVRELRNTLARILLFKSAEVLGEPPPDGDATKAVAKVASTVPFHDAREAVIADFERRYVAEHLQANDGNISAAARAMGVSRQFLHKLVAEHGIKGSPA